MSIKLMHLVMSIMHVMPQVLIGQDLQQHSSHKQTEVEGVINAIFSICALLIHISDRDKYAQIVMMGSNITGCEFG